MKIVYIGSFDPFHNGHKEAIDIMKSKGKIIIMPNAPRKGKPCRTSIMIRVLPLSKIYPIFLGYKNYMDLNLDVVVDNLPVNIALSELKGSYSAIIGSDIVKLPKYQPLKWYIIERKGYPIDPFLREFYGVPAEVIPLTETRYQHISSTLIRNSVLDPIYSMPSILADIYNPKKLLGFGIGDTVYDPVSDTYIKYLDAIEYCRKYRVIRSKLLDAMSPIQLPVTKNINKAVVIDGIKDSKTMFDVIVGGDIVSVKLFISLLNKIHWKYRFNPWCHGDLSVTNVLIVSDTYYLIDYESFKDNCMPSHMINDYYRLLSSIRYYGLLKGYDLTKELIEVKNYGDIHYDFQYKYLQETDDIKKKWGLAWENDGEIPSTA